jgi:hypothetical protein
MSLSMENLKDKLRRGLGNLTLTQLSDDQAGDAVTSALNEYSKHKPNRVLDYIGTKKDEALYDLSDRKRIMKVKEVYYNVGFEFSFDQSWPEPDLLSLGRLEGISLFENPSIWTQFMQRIEQYKTIFQGDFDYNRETKTLMLIPPPSVSGKKVFFVWAQNHIPETIPDEDVDTLLLWAKGEAKEMMASKKGSDIQSVSGYGESVSFGATSDSLMNEAKDFKDRFERKFGGSVFVVG